MQRLTLVRRGRYWAVIGLLVSVSLAVAQDNASDAALLIDVLRVQPGSVLADIGAGPGALLTTPMDRAVGDSGKVYATDFSQMLGRLRESIEKAGVKNVEVVEGQPSSTNLPAECCDGIFIRNVYHHFADPPAMNRSF